MSDVGNREEAEIVAAKKGLMIVTPAANELFVDIDDCESWHVFMRHFHIVKAALPGCVYTKRPSPSGAADRFHVVVTLPRDVATVFERIMLQALLGSDRLHETLSWRAAACGSPEPTLFFEKLDVALEALSRAKGDAR